MSAHLLMLAAWCAVSFFACIIACAVVGLYALFGPSFTAKPYEVAYDCIAAGALILFSFGIAFGFVGWAMGHL